jgi:hypothetical protein
VSGVPPTPSPVRVRRAAIAVAVSTLTVLVYQMIVHGGLGRMDGGRWLFAVGIAVVFGVRAYFR